MLLLLLLLLLMRRAAAEACCGYGGGSVQLVCLREGGTRKHVACVLHVCSEASANCGNMALSSLVRRRHALDVHTLHDASRPARDC
jgi:hypothetical protein